MSTVRDALRVWDSRLTSGFAVVFLLLAFDFFSRVVSFLPDSSRPVIEEAGSLSDTVPQISQPQADRYLSNIAGLIALPRQAQIAQPRDEIASQRKPASQPAEGYLRLGELSYKLTGLVESSERFGVLYSLDNDSGAKELIELRVGDSVQGYSVSEVLDKKLSLISGDGDQITLTLFEPEELQD